MAEGDGFEVGSAFVSVSPEVADFAAELDELLGGLTVAVRVAPDASDFAEQVDEQVGNLEATVSVGANTTAAESEVNALLSDVNSMRGQVYVGADTAAARDQADALAEELSSATASINVGANTGGASEGVAALSSELESLQGAATAAEGAVDGVDAKMATLAAAADASTGAVAGLNSELAGVGAGVAAADAHLAGLGSGLAAATAGLGAGVASIGVDVMPDMAQFEQALAEAAGGFTVEVRVLPETSNFAQALDEEAGGLTVPVRVVPDTAEFNAALGELEAEAAATGGAFEAAEGGVSSFTASLHEIGPAAAEASGELATFRDIAAAPLTGLSAESQAAVDALNGIGNAAAENASSMRSEFAGMADELNQLSYAIEATDERFGSFAQAGHAADETLSYLYDEMQNLRSALDVVQGEFGSFDSELSAAGGHVGDLEGELGALNGMLRELDAALGSADAQLAEAAGEFFQMDEMAQRLGTTIEGLPAALEGLDAKLTASAASGSASIEALNASMLRTGEEGGKAAGAVEEVGKSTGMLASRLAYMATDPFAWMMVATVAAPILASALSHLGDTASMIVAEFTKQDQAVGYNVAGFQKLAGQLGATAAGFQKTQDAVASATQNFVGGQHVTQLYGGTIRELDAAQQAALNSASNLTTNLYTLESTYGLTTKQAEQLATAAGVTAKQLAAGGDASAQAMAKIEAYANANVNAAGPVNAISNDMEIYSNNALTAATRTSALDDAFNRLVGNFVDSQQAQLQVQQDFLTIASNAQQTGATMSGTSQASLTLQQSFYSTIPAIEQTADAMVKNGDSTQQVNAYIQTQIDKLSPLAAGNANAMEAVQGLKQWEDNLKDSTGNVNEAIQQLTSQLETGFIKTVDNAGVSSTTAKTDIDQLTTSIQNTGTTSSNTASARAQLIKDLEASGVNAKTATDMVDGYIKKIGGIPTSKELKLLESASGQWSLSEVNANTGKQKEAAAGWYVSGGTPGKDSVPIMAMPGELVVPTAMVEGGAVDHLRGAIPGFGAGGVVGGSFKGDPAGLGAWTVNEYNQTENTVTSALKAAVEQAIKDAKAAAQAKQQAAAAASSGGGGGGGGAGGAAQWKGVALSALSQLHQPASDVNIVLSQINSESGGNPTIVNKWDSNWTAGHPSVGLMQVIAGTFARYAGPYRNTGPFEYGVSTNPMANVYAGLNYAIHNYPNWTATLGHGHGYATGGAMSPGEVGMVGEHGPEFIQAGKSGATVTPLGAGGHRPIAVNFYGTQYPTIEQQQALMMGLTQAVAMA